MTILYLQKPGILGRFRKKVEVKLYEGTDEMPQNNYNDVNIYSMQDFEIGNTMGDVDKHFNQLFAFLANGKTKEALQKAKNMYQTFYHMVERIDFKALQFGCFIHSIDGKEVTDYSVASIQNMIRFLSDHGLTNGMITQQIDSLKKNSTRS